MNARALLLPLSLAYRMIVAVRNWFFEIGILKIERVGVPVISVGNISVGGTGKTPFIELLAQRLQDRGKKVAIISRGYGRKSTGYQVVSNGNVKCAEAWTAGDEPSQLADSLPKTIIAVDEDSARAAKNIARHFQPDVILLDDGFQHRYLHRDVNIVLMTANEILEGDRLLPAGNYREPLSSLERADIVVITKSDNSEVYARAKSTLAPRFRRTIVGVETLVRGIRRVHVGDECEPAFVQGKVLVAVSGIARPDTFEAILQRLSVRTATHIRFGDHHWFTQKDVEKIAATVQTTNAEGVVTTEKDLVRMRGGLDESMFGKIPVYAVHIGYEFLDGGDALMSQIVRTLTR